MKTPIEAAAIEVCVCVSKLTHNKDSEDALARRVVVAYLQAAIAADAARALFEGQCDECGGIAGLLAELETVCAR